MKMKKLAGLLMAGVMVLSMAACGGNDDASGNDDAAEPKVEAEDQADDNAVGKTMQLPGKSLKI